ncbi:taste receptor type 2 member 2-like [Pithys albifrons albifrons]|uniref:taste receptor type 2 member 2-like n=1 Tax=Pithys albifrons albifrons TaxID=3385563 RepID=UPI003A5D0642
MEGCHSADISNVTSYDAMTVAIVTFEAFGGMWINALIVSVICVVWIKNKTLNSIEKILLFLGFSRFWYLCLAWVNYFLSVIYPNYIYFHPIFPLVQSTQSFFICSDFWFSACLCVFYCIKIANFRNSFLIYLKEKIDRMVPWLLLGSELFSLMIGILDYELLDKGLRNKATLTCHGIIWKANIRIEENFFQIYFITAFLFATSFTAVILSALLLLFSLWRHKHNMQTNSMKDVSMDAHIKAMKSTLSFLVMYSINFISLILGLVYSMKNENDMMFPIFLIQYAFPSLHSLILIFSNPKLKKILLRILPCVNCKNCIK